MTTLNQIVKRIEEISDQHYFVKTFQSGDGSQIAELDQSGALIYPLAFLEDKPATSTGGAFYYNFDLIIVDLVQDDRSNEQEVKSDCLQSAIDFITTLSRLDIINESTDAYFYSEQSVTYSFVSEQFQDRVSGVRASISLKQGFEFNTCILPITGNVNCGTAFNCTDLINSLTATELNECILPNYDFSNATVQGNVTAGQQTDLDAWLCTGAVCVDATVENSDVSYQTTVGNGATLVLPDVDAVLNATGAVIVSSPSVIDIDINIEYDDGVDVGSVVSNVVEIPDNRYNVSSARRSGQTISYATNDDGDLELGRETSFTVLDHNNPYGDTNRFRDDAGGGTYTSNWVIDWASADYVNKTVIGWFRSAQGGGTTNWATAMSGQPYTLGGYADCYVPNFSQLNQIVNFGVVGLLNYAPLNINPALRLWSSTTPPANTTFVYIAYCDLSTVGRYAKTNTDYYIVNRIFTFAEVGL